MAIHGYSCDLSISCSGKIPIAYKHREDCWIKNNWVHVQLNTTNSGDDFSLVKAQYTLISCKVAGERWSRDFVDQKPPQVLGLVGPS